MMRIFAVTTGVGFLGILAVAFALMDPQAQALMAGFGLGVVVVCATIAVTGWTMRQMQPRQRTEEPPRALGQQDSPPFIIIQSERQPQEVERRVTWPPRR